MERRAIAEEVRSLDQDMRAGLRALGVRFGAYHIYVPQLLKPGPSALLATLWGLSKDASDGKGIAELPAMSAAGRTTIPYDSEIPKPLYRVVGYRVSGERAVRIDILERLADLIRPLIGWRPTAEDGEPPEGAVPPGGFMVTQQMTSLLGASGDAFSTVLKSLGYDVERRPAPPAPASAEATVGPDKTGDEATAVQGPDEGTTEAAAAPDAIDAALAALKASEAVGEPGESGAATAAPSGAEGAATVEAETAADTAEAEPAFIEIWRPARTTHRRQGGDRRGRRAPKPDRQKAGAPAGRGEQRRRKNAAGPDGKQRRAPAPRPARPRREEKRLDPDSPFAALAALKATLEDQKSE